MRKKILLMLMVVCGAVWSARAQIDMWGVTTAKLITSSSQMSDNCAWNTAMSSALLVDGNKDSYLHSDATKSISTTTSWFQVSLSEAQQAFTFYLMGRGDGKALGYKWYDTPDQMEIQASNTPNDDDSWKTVYEWDARGIIAKDHYVEYTSPVIVMDQPYSNVRFIVKHTATGAKYFNFSEFMMYQAMHITTYVDGLTYYTDSIYQLSREYATGTAVGYYDADKVAAFDAAYATAYEKLEDDNLDEATAQTVLEGLLGSFAAVEDSWVKPTAGYYAFVSADSIYDDQEERAMYINTLGDVVWGKYSATDANYIFQIEEDTVGWKIYNPAQKRYLAAPASSLATTSTTYTTAQALTHYGEGYPSFKIATAAGSSAYAVTGEGDGTIAEGSVGVLNGTATSAAGWKLVQIDETTAKDLIAKADASYYTDMLQNAVDDALRLRSKVVDLTPLITDASQIEANDAANLIDGNRATYSESADGIDFENDDEYIDITLDEAVKEFTLAYVGRKNATTYDTPNKFVISASNDGNNYTEIGTYNIKSLANASEAQYVSPVISLGAEYTKVRIAIKGVTSNADKWNLSELQLYGSEKLASSEYLLVEGMSDAVDNLDAAVAAALAKIASGEVVADDTTAVLAAMADVQELYVDKSVVASALQSEIAAATEVYNKAFLYDDLLIEAYNDGKLGQISGSEGVTFSSAPNLAFACLIDGKEDMGSFFHSSLTAITDNGYLQFDLRRLVSKFTFWMDGAYFYNAAFPSVIDVYASNTPDDADSWKKITTVNNPNSPAVASNYHFQSDVVNLGDEYRYIRFYVKDNGYSNTALAAYWMIAEMQITDASPNTETSQYYYMDGVKEAADALMEVVANIQKKIADGTVVNMNDTVELHKAVATLQDSFYDTSVVSNLVDELHDLLDKTPKGDEIGQVNEEVYSDIQVSLLETEAELDFDIVDPSAMDEALETLNKLYTDFWTNYRTVDSCKWYYIKSKCASGTIGGQDMSSEFAERGEINGSVIFTRSLARSIQLRWGLKDKYDGDSRAMWQFIPVPGKIGGYYYIKNLYSGSYIGQSNTGSDCFVSTVGNAMVMRLYPAGDGSITILPADETSNSTAAIGAGDNANQVRCDQTASRNYWTFEEATPAQTKIRLAQDNMRIITLPFAMSGLDENADIQTYSLKSVTTDGTALNFVKKSSFEAGEPILIIVGDTTGYSKKEHPEAEYTINTPTTDYVTSAGAVNGMHGVMNSATLKSAGYGYFSGAALKVTTGASSVSIGFQSGYINRNEIPVAAEDETYDIQIKVFGDGVLNGIATISNGGASDTVNVYTIDGVLLKKNVKAAGATEGLAKGVYIVGKDKVLVK